MKRALMSFRVKGVKTSIPFELAVMDCPNFVNGSYDTGFIENNFDFQKLNNVKKQYEEMVAAIAAFSFKMVKDQRLLMPNVPRPSKWKLAGRVSRGR